MTRAWETVARTAVLGAAGALLIAGTGPALAVDSPLVINEIDYDQPGTDTAEFVELRNVGATSLSLSGHDLQFVNGSTASVYSTIALPAVTLAAGDYFVVCANAATVPNCDLDSSPDTNFIQNGSPDAIVLLQGSAIVDAVSYEGDTAVPYTEGSGSGLEDDSSSGGSISRCPDGADTNQNNVDLQFTSTATPGMANACATQGLVINEIDYDQPGTDTAEFVEIRNNGTGPIALGSYVLELINGTGGGATVYATIPLTSETLAAGDYFVVCANAATVTNCDLDVTPDTNLIQNGAPDAVALRDGATLVDTVSYEGDTGAPYTEGSGTGLEDPAAAGSLSRCPDGADTGQNNLDLQFAPISTPGVANDCSGAREARIHEVQGSGGSVAINTPVRLEAVVTGDYQAGDQLRGFFLQEEDSDADGDAATSEGIFVFCSACPTDVSVGDVVQVTGAPGDFFGMSQVTATQAQDIRIVGTGQVLPTPVTIDLPAAGSTRAESTFENLEGMLVRFADRLVVSEYFELARYGQLVLTETSRPRQFTDFNGPDAAAYAASVAELESRRIILDDDNNIQNDALGSDPSQDEPYYWPRPGLSNSNFLRGGDGIEGLTGILHWSFAGSSGTDAWRIRPVEPTFSYDFTRDNSRPEAPGDVGGSMKVASFNVLNYFTTLDSRGADSVAELDRQRRKTAAAICALDADVVGLIEIENNGPVALGDLLDGTDGVNAACGPYAYIDTGTIGVDEIAVALVYRTATTAPAGSFAILDGSVDPRFLDSLNRPALAQTFEETASGARLTVVVSHLKSKGSDCEGVGDPDLGDGQGNCNVTRTQAAAALVDWLATDPTGSGDTDVLIVGDLNAYRKEDPVHAIRSGADDVLGTADDYTDLLDYLLGPDAYTYVFDGQLGYLDHALASASLLDQVTGVVAWPVNADEIPMFDYNDDIDDGSSEASFERESTSLPIYAADAYRSSDHDPVVVGIEFDSDRDGVIDRDDHCPGTMIPEAVPTEELRGKRWALVDGDLVFDTDVAVAVPFTTADTAGCSCEQIIARAAAGRGHEKFGCSNGLMEYWIATRP
jgi:predicted extracellular nuclease